MEFRVLGDFPCLGWSFEFWSFGTLSLFFTYLSLEFAYFEYFGVL